MQAIGSFAPAQRWRRLRSRGLGLGAELPTRRGELIWGVVGVAMVIVVAIGAGALYMRPPGESSFSALMTESGGVKSGDEVRIAGVPVGKVLRVGIAGDRVRLDFSVKDTYSIGAQTSIAVRMLTPVGGLYLALLPDGAAPLREPIPAQRVALPYTIGALIESGHRVSSGLDAAALRQSTTELAQTMAGSPGAIRSILTHTRGVIDLFAAQKKSIEDMVSLSNEYVTEINGNKEVLLELLRGYAAMGPALMSRRVMSQQFADDLLTVLGKVFEFLGGPWQTTLEPMILPLEDSIEQLNLTRDKLTALFGQVRTATRALAAMVGPEGQAVVNQQDALVDLSAVCLPVPGRSC
ncbi:MlaD family protein [Gordonia sp. CPCC 205333]|uniref:MlaD family protein n=1 Tax=Gordonia sp. CPCC 205333 TaxID=3140790 RepID=UPI003AF3725B